MGYLDGAYYAYSLSNGIKAGLAIGSSPSYSDSGFDFKRKKAGLFITYETGNYESNRLVLSSAFNTEYQYSTVSRDFLYVQSDYSLKRKLFIYQSAEIDINRNWRYQVVGKRLQLTNYFGSARIHVRQNLSIRLSYDNRKTIRYYESRDIVDSLFDDRTRKGLRGGVDWSISKMVRVFADGGIRLRNDVNGNSRNGSIAMRVNGFPRKLQSLYFRLSWVNNDFLTAYRPYLAYRFRILRTWNISLSAMGYLFESSTAIDDNYTLDLDASRYFRNRYFLTVQFRQYLDSYLQSTEIRTELGVSF